MRGHRPGVFFTLGAVYEDLGRNDEAWRAYAQANTVAPQHYDRARADAFVASLMETFSAGAMWTLARSSEKSQLPVFIVGMPRSGTTLVEQIISSHPKAAGAGELRDMARLARGAAQRFGLGMPLPMGAGQLTGQHLDTMAREYLQVLRGADPAGAGGAGGGGGGGAERITDKMPHNFELIGLISMMLPGARVIHCLRHPLDNLVSILATQLSPAHTYAHRPEDAAHEYINHRRLMDHWKAVAGLPILEVVYEDLVRDPENGAKQIIAFTGLEWDEACLRFYESKRTVATASLDQVRRPVYDTSIGRWRKFEKHLRGVRGELEAYVGPHERAGAGA